MVIQSIVVVGLAIMFGLVVIPFPYMSISLLAAICFFMGNRKRFIVFSVIAPIFTGFLANYTGIQAFNYVDDLCAAVLVLLCCFHVFQFRRTLIVSPIVKVLLKVIAVFIFIVLLSALINHSKLYGICYFIDSFLKLFIVIISMLLMFDEKDIKRMFKILLVVGVVEVFFAMIQFGTFNSIRLLVGPEVHILEDSATGTMGIYGADLLGHFMLLLTIFTILIYTQTKQMKWVVFAFVYFSAFVLTFTEKDYIFLGLFSLWLLFANRQIKIITKLVFVVSIIGITFYLGSNSGDFLNRYYKYVAQPKQILHTEKMKGFIIAADIAQTSVVSATIGNGPGSFCSAGAGVVKSKLFMKYIRDFSQVKSSLDFIWCTIVTLVVEAGVLGVMAYVLLFLHILKVLWKSVSIIKFPYEKAVILGAMWSLGMLFFLFPLINVMENPSFIMPVAVFIAYGLSIAERASKRV